jgi:hypothetical protein
MIGEEVRHLLVAEMKASQEFSRQNFGLAMGEEYREMVEEVLKSTEVVALLVCSLLITNLNGRAFAESMRGRGDGETDNEKVIRKAILANMETFRPQFDFLYWGVQVGMKLARAEMEALKGLEQQ